MPPDKPAPFEWSALRADHRLTDAEIEQRARDLLARMTLTEKIGQMTGDMPRFRGMLDMARAYNRRPYPAGENRRLGIPPLLFTDGPRGVVIYRSTCFPVSMARGAAWDVELEERVGDAMGVEARSQGANFFGGVCINLLRHPAWGRAQETYGEDPYHLGEMGAALVRGVQRHVMACVKHYAANSIENSRMKVDVRMDERTLREIYLPHFRRCVDEGVAAVMSAYNKVSGEHCGHSAHLLRDILKGEWGFRGLVMSDFVWGIRDAEAAAKGGLDVEMPLRQHYHARLGKLVQSGAVPAEVVDEAALRVLRQKIRFAQADEPGRYGREAVAGEAHRALAREAARKSMVLLKNDPVVSQGDRPALPGAGSLLPGDGASLPRDGTLLPGSRPLLPLDRARLRRLAVIGRLAAEANTGDHGSSRVRPPYVVTPLAGLQAAAGRAIEIMYRDGRDVHAAVEAARAADVAIVVAGYTYRDEGERIGRNGGDRASLSLALRAEALIRAVAEANPRTVVVLVGGSAIITEAWRAQVPAILMAWYSGMEGGHALADLVFGDAVPSGKLPCVFPVSATHLPPFDSQADSIEYGYYHGYRLLERDGHEPAFPFGFGLSYASFSYSNLRLSEDAIGPGGVLGVHFAITNTAAVAADEVAQLYVGYEGSALDRPVKELKGFARVHLEPGETVEVEIVLPARSLACYDERRAGWIVEPIGYRVYAGPSSRTADLLTASFRVRG